MLRLLHFCFGGLIARVSALKSRDTGSNPGQVISKTLKISLVATYMRIL